MNWRTAKKLRVYTTHRALWVALSILVFVAIGFLVRGDVKGDHPSLFRLMAWGIKDVFPEARGFMLYWQWPSGWGLGCSFRPWLAGSCRQLLFSSLIRDMRNRNLWPNHALSEPGEAVVVAI